MIDALGTFKLSPMGTIRSQTPEHTSDDLDELRDLLGKIGGRREDRTRDLRIANAALSQLS